MKCSELEDKALNCLDLCLTCFDGYHQVLYKNYYQKWGFQKTLELFEEKCKFYECFERTQKNPKQSFAWGCVKHIMHQNSNLIKLYQYSLKLSALYLDSDFEWMKYYINFDDLVEYENDVANLFNPPKPNS